MTPPIVVMMIHIRSLAALKMENDEYIQNHQKQKMKNKA